MTATPMSATAPSPAATAVPESDHMPTIVVGYDGSDAARAAVGFARRRAGAAGRVFIVHAYHLPSDLLGSPHYEHLLEERQRNGREVLAQVAPQGDDARVETELIGGPAAAAIVDVARVRDADEIVVGARGLSRARAFLGGVSIELLHLADRPVVVIPAAALAGDAPAG